jgi:predicted nucleic acid-binding protein
MIVISDASPLRSLILIDQAERLRELSDRVLIPQAVARELRRARTPEKVQVWMRTPPPWLETTEVPEPDPTLRLGAGEREAITLAGRYADALLVTDDAKARRAAIERGIAVIGTLGVLEAAATKGWEDLPLAIDRLRRETNFRAAPFLLETVLERERERRRLLPERPAPQNRVEDADQEGDP